MIRCSNFRNERSTFFVHRDSVVSAYNAGVFSKEYAVNKLRNLCASYYGVYSGIFYELSMTDFEEIFMGVSL